MSEYAYQRELTKRLDGLENTSFTQELVNEIVLWKLNRYVSLDKVTLDDLERLRGLRTGEHKRGKSVLESLLQSHGVDLPMASTILRFRNANTFQIVDRHAYRALYGKDYPLYSGSSVKKKIELYFDYLDDLAVLCKKRRLAFETIDRLLYIFDKRKNGKLNEGRNPQQA